jgi:RNA polymerase sigma-70 factor (ECF subfamily)
VNVVERDLELQLVGRLRAGDPEAFNCAYEEYRSRLFTFLARMCRSRDDAEDLLEETWLRLVASAARLEPDTRLGPWLFTVARNTCYSARRSRRLEASSVPSLLGLWPVPSPRPSPFEECAAGELERRVEAALAALPVNQREAVLLVGVEGFTPSEAAAICRISPETMRQRLSRARAEVGRRLERRGWRRRAIASEAIP